MPLDTNRIEMGENLTSEFKREYTEEIKKTIIAKEPLALIILPEKAFVPKGSMSGKDPRRFRRQRPPFSP